jgi:iron complex outermembrane receptor protein
MQHRRRVYSGLLLFGLIGSGLGTSAAEEPPRATPATAQTPTTTATTEPQLEAVVVSGLRESLAKSLQEKQNAEIVQDSINALELGRFPDDDVADSLRHITGVNISRTTGGEGQYVGVRGLGSQYNIVTLNNRILATDDDGRALAFDVLPADVISGADVFKSSQASALEGSIGGTVNMRSARPFDNPGLHSAARIEGNYDDMSEFWGKKGSVFVSDTNSAGTLGFLIGGVVSDTRTRTDALNYNTYDGANPGVWPLTGPNSQPVVAECCISFGSVIDEKKREAISGTLEWRPSDTLHVALDGLYTRLNDPQVAYNQAYYPDFNYDANGNPEWSNVVVKNGFITSFTANTFTPEIVNQTIARRVTTSLLGLNASWQPTSNFTVDADVYQSKANRPEGGNDAFVTSGLESATPYNQDIINWTNNPNGGLPFISVILPNGQNYASALASGALNNNFWTAHYTGLNGNTIHDKVSGATLNGTLKFDDTGPLRQLRFGVAETLRHKSRDDFDNDWTGGSSQYDFYTTPAGATPITYGSLGANVISITSFPNYMQGAGGSFPTSIAVFNIPNLLNALKKLNGQPNTYIAGAPNYDFAATLPQFNAVNSYNVRENTTAGYFEAAFAGVRWAGNIGVRLVHTSTTASTAVDEIQTVTIANTANPTDPAFVNYSNPTPTTSTGSYTLPLPSLNFVYRFRPDLQLRFGASETMSRPELDQLAPTRTDNTLNRVYEITYAGNADLKPIKAWSADISVEWYYQPKSALTLALFGKDIKDFITTGTQNNVNLGVQGFFNGSTSPVPVLYTVFTPINGDKGYVSGLELGFQHILPSGFGVHGQYTRTWSQAYVGGQYVGQLEGVSPNSASLGVLYETGPISANVNWDYDGPSVAETFTEIEGLSAYQSGFSWVTAQLSYEVFKGFKIYFEGKNLANAIARTYLANRQDEVWSAGNTGGPNSASGGTTSSVGQGYTAYGRMYTLGLSYRF